MSDLTLIYPYYDNGEMLKIQYEHWDSYSSSVKTRLDIILIDDGSQKKQAINFLPKEHDFKLRLYRVKENIPWNQHGCRNLGMKETNTDWNLLTDMDMVVPEETILDCLNYRKTPREFYTFERVKMPHKEPYKYHCNSLMIHSETYWKIGGYDEDYCGTYGGDGPFARLLQKHAQRVHLPNSELFYYPRGYLADAGTNEWERTGKYKKAYRDRWDKKRAKGDEKPKNPVRFEWERVF